MNRLISLVHLYRYDLRCGFHGLLPRLGLAGCLAALCDIVTFLHASSNPSHELHLNYSAYLASIFGGTSEFVPERAEFFVLPAAWLCNCLAISYVTLDYPAKHLGGVGTMAITLSGSRWSWWLSKCAWVVTCCLLCYGIDLIVCILCAIGTGASADLGFSKELAQFMGFFMATGSPLAQDTSGVEAFLLCAPTALAAISLVQLAFSVLCTPYMGFIVTVCSLFASAFLLNPMCMGNYLMIARSNLAIPNGVDALRGAIIACSIAAAAVLIGGAIFSRQSLIKRRTDTP